MDTMTPISALYIWPIWRPSDLELRLSTPMALVLSVELLIFMVGSIAERRLWAGMPTALPRKEVMMNVIKIGGIKNFNYGL